MAMNWFQTLQDEDAKSLTVLERLRVMAGDKNVPVMLASDTYREVEQAAQAFDRIVSRMEDDDASDDILRAADMLQDRWAKLATLAVNVLRQRQGKSTIAFPGT
nr:hypothetical protein [uncultured Shinella sp.]